jgi:hypothetical protein
MRIGVRALLGCLAVATAVAAVLLIALPRTANVRPAAFRDARVAAAGPRRPDPTPPPPTADAIDVPSDQELVTSANTFLTVDLVVVSGLGLIIVVSLGWIVVRLVRGGEF